MVRIAFAVLFGAAIASTALANVAEPEEFVTRDVAEQDDLFGRAAAQVMNDMFSREELSDMFGREIVDGLTEREIEELMTRELEIDDELMTRELADDIDLMTREVGLEGADLEARSPGFLDWFKEKILRRKPKKDKKKKDQKKKKDEEEAKEEREFVEDLQDFEARSFGEDLQDLEARNGPNGSIFGILSRVMGSAWNNKQPPAALVGGAPAKKGADKPAAGGAEEGGAPEARELEFEEPIERSLEAADDLFEREFDDADLLERDYDDADLFERDFDDADLFERDFDDADLFEREFDDVDLLERDYEGELYERDLGFDEEVFERELQAGLDELYERASDILAQYDELD